MTDNLSHCTPSVKASFGGPWENRTPNCALQGHCVPSYTNSPKYNRNAFLLFQITSLMLLFAATFLKLVPNSEFESLTYRLSSECSTTELIGNNWYQETGSNRPHLVLQTSALPTELSWHKNSLGCRMRIELMMTESQSVVLPLN